MDRRIVESDVRYRIDSLFREAGIVIAFPQRDVHLDTVRPIEVRLLPENNPSSPTGECSTPAVRADGAQAGSQEA